MLRSRLEGDDRVGALTDLGIGVLNKYTIKFNKQSTDGSGKTNIIPNRTTQVLGVVYDLSLEQMEKLTVIEKGYDRVTLPIQINGKKESAETFIAQAKRINNDLLPTCEYLGFLIQGAKDHQFPSEYVIFLEGVRCK